MRSQLVVREAVFNNNAGGALRIAAGALIGAAVALPNVLAVIVMVTPLHSPVYQPLGVPWLVLLGAAVVGMGTLSGLLFYRWKLGSLKPEFFLAASAVIAPSAIGVLHLMIVGIIWDGYWLSWVGVVITSLVVVAIVFRRKQVTPWVVNLLPCVPLGVLSVIFITVADAAWGEPLEPMLLKRPTVSDITPNTAIVRAEIERGSVRFFGGNSCCLVLFGKTAQYDRQQEGSGTFGLVLDDLLPDTLYHYRLKGCRGYWSGRLLGQGGTPKCEDRHSRDYTFRTLPEPE